MNPWLGISLVLSALTAQIVMLVCAVHGGKIHVKVSRKILHVGMGLLALNFPWLFREFWPIALLAVVGTGGVLALRLKRFRNGPGLILGGDYCWWCGIVCFSAGIAWIFAWYLQGGEYRLLLYVVPLLMLVVADAVAGVVGVYFGRHRFLVLGATKSLEGSSAFFVAAFASSVISLSFTELAPGHLVLIAATFSLSMTLLESIAGWGTDNILLPVLGHLALSRMLGWSKPILSVSLLCEGLLIVILVRSAVARCPASTFATIPSSSTHDTIPQTAATSRIDCS
jgi:phytol kinase